MSKKRLLLELKIFLILTMVISLFGCKLVETGFYIESTQIDKNNVKPGDEIVLEVRIAKKTGRQQIQHTVNMAVEVTSSNPNIEIIPIPLTEAETVSNNSTITVIERAGGVLPRPFKFKIKIKESCKPGNYILKVKSNIDNEEDLKIINIIVEGG